MMIFATLIYWIAFNTSANGTTTTDYVTATIKYGEGEHEWVNCRGVAVYDEETKKGVLYMDSYDPVNQVRLDVLQIIQTLLQNDTIARRYYLGQPRPVWITTVTEVTQETSLVATPAVEVRVGLQILPGVQGSLVLPCQLDPKNWEVEIPYCRDDETVFLKETKAELTLLDGVNKVVDCTVKSIAQGAKWLLLRIKKSPDTQYFMNLQRKANSIFLEYKEPSLKAFFQVSIGYMQEFKHEFYAEIKVQPPKTVVQITMKDTVNRVRRVYGFGNERCKEIWFFPGSRVQSASADDPDKFEDIMEDVSWAFEGAASLEVGTHIAEGKLDGLTAISSKFLSVNRLKCNEGDRTYMVLEYYAVHQPAIIRK